MTREEREEAKEVIKAYHDKLTNSASNQLDGDIKAFELAIKALEQEPSGDAVSRQAVLSYINRIQNQGTGKKKSFKFIQKFVEKLPSAEKTGRWTATEDGFECSECGCVLRSRADFCQYCSARMVEPQESEG